MEITCNAHTQATPLNPSLTFQPTCVTKQTSVHNLHALCRPLHTWQYKIISSLTDICHVSVLLLSHVQISLPVESVYWFHIVIIFPGHIIFLLLSGVRFLLGGLLSLACWTLFTACQWSVLCIGVVSLARLAISRQIFWGTDQIWQSYIGDTTVCKSEGNCDVIWLEIHVWQGFARGMFNKNFIYLFSRILLY